MSEAIIYRDGAYNIFDSTEERPRYDTALSLEQLTEEVRREHGESGIDRLPKRLERAHATGCSAPGWTLDECIRMNRAGEDEAKLTADDFVARFLTLPEVKEDQKVGKPQFSEDDEEMLLQAAQYLREHKLISIAWKVDDLRRRIALSIATAEPQAPVPPSVRQMIGEAAADFVGAAQRTEGPK